MKREVEVKTVDVGKTTYKITTINGKIFYKTMEGRLSTNWYGSLLGPDRQLKLHVRYSTGFLDELAGKWESYTVDTNDYVERTLKSSQVLTVEITSTVACLKTYTKVYTKTFWDEVTTFHTEKGII